MGWCKCKKKKSLSVKLLVLSDRIRHRATWESAERSLHWVSGNFPSWLKKYQAACFVDESITAQGPLAEGHTLSQYKTLSQYVIQSDCEKKKEPKLRGFLFIVCNMIVVLLVISHGKPSQSSLIFTVLFQYEDAECNRWCNGMWCSLSTGKAPLDFYCPNSLRREMGYTQSEVNVVKTHVPKNTRKTWQGDLENRTL